MDKKQTLGDVRKVLAKNPDQRSAADSELIRDAATSLAEAGKIVDSSLATLNQNLAALQALPARPATIRVTPALDEFFHGEQRQKEAGRQREVAMLESLQAIRESLNKLTDIIAAHDRQLKEHEENLVRLRSGGPGRPTAMHLVRAEFEARVTAENLEPTVKEQGRVLELWLREAHPQAHPLTSKAIENNLRKDYRRARAAGFSSTKRSKHRPTDA